MRWLRIGAVVCAERVCSCSVLFFERHARHWTGCHGEQHGYVSVSLSRHKAPSGSGQANAQVCPTTAGVIYPILIRRLIVKISFGWTMRCFALIVLTTNCASLALMRPRLK